MSAEQDWPYDARRDHPLTAYRIAATSSHPRWSYLVAFDVEGSAEDPTEFEMLQLASFLDEYRLRWYNERWLTKMAERPYDIDGGANATIFRKYGQGDWGYRKDSWTYGPLFVPQYPNLRSADAEPWPLVRVMDQVHSFGLGDGPFQSWLDWKAAHPGVF